MARRDAEKRAKEKTQGVTNKLTPIHENTDSTTATFYNKSSERKHLNEIKLIQLH